MREFTRKSKKTTTPRRRALRPEVNALETRLALSATASLHAAAFSSVRAPVLGTISGQVTNQATDRGVGRVRVELFNATGRILQTTRTNFQGQYHFRVRQNGAYVVHEVASRRFQQTTPTFPNVAPTGSYAPGAGSSSWTYSGANTNPQNGPVNPYAWDTIAPAGNLPFESPIDIRTPYTDLGRVLSVNFNPAVPTKIVNNGHQFQVQFPANNPSDTLNVDGVTYNLAQFHYHSPSETQFLGGTAPLEEHFVATSAAGGEAVLTVFFQVGAHNDALDPILNAAVANLTKSGSSTPGTVPVNFAGLVPSSLNGWFYEGSLTTPPLSQPVTWFVLATPLTLDAQQLATYQQVATAAGFDPNARPVQPLDGRRLNQMDYDVNFQNQSVAGLNFTIARR